MSQDKISNPSRRLYYIAMGANLESSVGTPEQTLTAVTHLLGEYTCFLVNASRLFSTPAFPAGSGPDYVNAAASVEGPSNPLEFLKILHSLETRFGRTRDTRWGQRTLDLDLIAADQMVLPDLNTYEDWKNLKTQDQRVRAPDQLIVPHPRVQDRAFVLVPLSEIAPDWRHPVLGQTVTEMLNALPANDVAAVVPLTR